MVLVGGRVVAPAVDRAAPLEDRSWDQSSDQVVTGEMMEVLVVVIRPCSASRDVSSTPIVLGRFSVRRICSTRRRTRARCITDYA